MSTSHMRLMAIVAVIAASALTGAFTGLLAAPGGSGFHAAAAAAGFGGALVAGVTVLGLLGGRLKTPAAPASAVGADDSVRAAAEQLHAERRMLIDTCIYVRDRSTSQAISDKIGAALTESGVVTVTPTGERFDPTRHEAGGVTPAPDPAHDGVIAAVETVGYHDRQSILRHPIVTVYRAQPGGR